MNISAPITLYQRSKANAEDEQAEPLLNFGAKVWKITLIGLDNDDAGQKGVKIGEADMDVGRYAEKKVMPEND